MAELNRVLTRLESVGSMDDDDDSEPKASVDVEMARRNETPEQSDGAPRRGPSLSRKSRLRGSHRRMRHRGNIVEGEQQRQREEDQLAQDIIQDIVRRRATLGRGKALLRGPQGLDTIRESGLPLKEKRRVLTDVKREEETSRRGRRDRGIGCGTMCLASLAMKMQHLRYRFFDLVYAINLWKGSIKSVEGLFGTGVGSYFRFLKWLFLLNIPIFLICFSFVTIPQLVFDLSSNHSDVDCPRESFLGWELLTGKGNFTCSPLYYGHYTNRTFESVPGSGYRYNMPLFYIVSISLYFLINLVVIALRISSSYRVNFIEGSGDFKFYFVNKVFAGWDFGVIDAEAAILKKKSLRQEISEYISLIHARRKRTRDKRGLALRILQHLLINGIIIAFLACCGYLMYAIMDDDKENDDLEEIKKKPIIGQLMIPIIVTAVVFFVPKIFSLMTLVEKYELPQTKLYMTLLRTVCLYGIVFGHLVWFWTNTINDDSKDYDKTCWENKMGQEIYKLVIMDFIMTLLDSIFTDFLRSAIVKVVMLKILKRNPESVRGFLPNFNVALNVLNLIYSQSLTWFGIFYSPLLPVVQLVKLFLVFYLKKFTVLKNCAPFRQAWRGARIQTIFLILLFFGFMTAIVLLAYAIYLATPSTICGPYRGKTKVHDALLDFISAFYKDAPGLYKVVAFLSSSWFIIAIMIFLSIKVYYARVSSIAKLETITMLKNQLQLSSFDKQFLLRQIQENSDGKYKSNSAEGNGVRNKNVVGNLECRVKNPYGCGRGSEENTRFSDNSNDLKRRHRGSNQNEDIRSTLPSADADDDEITSL